VPELMELPPPTPGPGEVRVRVAAAGVNPIDWKIVDGLYEGQRSHRFPLVLGADGSGWVESRGPGASRFEVGEAIFGQFLHTPVGDGAYAEFAITPEANGVTRVPTELGPQAAAALPTSGMTALDALDRLSLASGNSLLLAGASGGIGSFAVQIARARGLRVIALARPGAESRLRGLGASDVLEYGSPSLGEQLRSLCPSGVDALLDAASRSPEFARLSGFVRKGGRALSTAYAAPPNSPNEDGVLRTNYGLQPTAPLLERVVRTVLDHKIRVPVEHELTLSQVPAALAESRAGRATGKSVVRVSDSP
jgi:NADPH:quinone reductase-like Zn-dependent oxidoreductase